MPRKNNGRWYPVADIPDKKTAHKRVAQTCGVRVEGRRKKR